MSNINELVMENIGSYRASVNSGDHGTRIGLLFSRAHPQAAKSGTGSELIQQAKMQTPNPNAINQAKTAIQHMNVPSHSGMSSVRGSVGETHSGNIMQGISNLINKFRN